MRRAQAFQPLVTGDACRTIGRGEGALRLRRIRTVVLDASDERGIGLDDLTIEFVIEVAAVNDVQASRPQHGPQLIRFRARGVGNGSIQGSSAEDVEVQVQLDAAMFRVFPQGPCHARKRAKDTAVYGGEIEQLVRVGSIDQRRGLGRQFLEDLVQGLGVKQPRGFAEGAQRRRPNPQSSLNGLQGRSLLQSGRLVIVGLKK